MLRFFNTTYRTKRLQAQAEGRTFIHCRRRTRTHLSAGRRE
jgi:hypothetical protein